MKTPRVLLLESDLVLAGNIAQYFGRQGVEVDRHTDPQAAISAADKSRPDVVVLDLFLAGRSGVEFLYEFRSYPDWHDLPVILLSSVSKKELGDSADMLQQLNVTEYLHKPYTPMAYLAEVVGAILQPARA